jgi:hypothetical protein
LALSHRLREPACLSVCVGMKKFYSQFTDFHEVLYRGFWIKSVAKFKFNENPTRIMDTSLADLRNFKTSRRVPYGLRRVSDKMLI